MGNWFEQVHSGMGTQMTHRAFGDHAEQALLGVRAEAERLEKLLSRFMPESDISRINRSAGIKSEHISKETCEVLELAINISQLCDGFFDVTIAPLVDLWNYKNAIAQPPDAEIRRALTLVNYRRLILDDARQTAELKKSGQAIDLGGIAKGFASDQFMEVFKNHGVLSAFSNIGGNVSTLGVKPDGSPWRVGIRHPRQNGLLGAVSVTGQSVVTSGDYERYFIDKDGKRFHHILNPKTGYPAESGLISVSVITPSAMMADALSTAIFVSGFKKGLAFLKKFPLAEAILVDRELNVHVTRGLRENFQTTEGISVHNLQD